MTDLREQAKLLALTEAASRQPARRPWHEVADLVAAAESARAVVDGSAPTYSEPRLSSCVRSPRRQPSRWSSGGRRLEAVSTLAGLPGSSLITVLDADYPDNLRKIYNRPPFLFIRGALMEEDSQSVAVVGTRQATDEGQRRAGELAEALARRGVTVVSGLASGIDTAAHTATLDAGGRTVAVMGTGIDRIYPATNKELAERIVDHGALVSQFWPGTPPRGTNFPLRNVVTSGIAIGTVVIEASATSGAKMQARLALEHGKRLLLMSDLVMNEEWAQRYASRRGATVVDSVDDVIAVLEAERSVPTALQLF